MSSLSRLTAKTWVISGANRGIGLEYVRKLSEKPDTHVVATVRTSNSLVSSPELSKLKAESDAGKKNITVLELDTASTQSISSFASSLIKAGVEKVDFLLNSAAINEEESANSLNFNPEILLKHISINVIAPAKITSSLVEAGLLQPGSVVMNMSSGLGSMTQSTGMAKTPDLGTKCTPYSISKAALNMLSIHQGSDLLRKKKVIVILMDPGWVKTDMGGKGAMLEPGESVGGMIKVLENVKDEDSGKFYHYNGTVVPW